MRCLAIFALIATATALPAQSSIPKPITGITDEDLASPAPYFNVPFFGDISRIFAPLWKLFPSFDDMGPRIYADEKKFQVAMLVKDYQKNDLKVKIKGDLIFVQGSHEAKQQDHDVFASQFFHTYTLPANSSASDVTAELTNDGYLIVNAPINGKVNRAKETEREVPIVETGAPYKPEEGPATTDATPEDERREPTTPYDKEDVTEKDNVIPHGNEVMA